MTKHVVSLKWAMKLKEAGYKQEGVWWWCYHRRATTSGFLTDSPFGADISYDEITVTTLVTKAECIAANDNDKVNKHITAPIATELLEELPTVEIEKLYKEYLVKNSFTHFYNKNLPNALAQMYCYLAEKNLVRGEK